MHFKEIGNIVPIVLSKLLGRILKLYYCYLLGTRTTINYIIYYIINDATIYNLMLFSTVSNRFKIK